MRHQKLNADFEPRVTPISQSATQHHVEFLCGEFVGMAHNGQAVVAPAREVASQ
jgi:hypothetical protein